MEEEKTAQEIEQIFRYGNDTVLIINDNKEKPEDESLEAWWKATIEENVDKLERVKAFKKLDGVTSIWTTEDFTDIDAAITLGKALIA